MYHSTFSEEELLPAITHSVYSLAHPLSAQYAWYYKQFAGEYSTIPKGEIQSIQGGTLRLYAVDQKVPDCKLLDHLGETFSILKALCEKPRSHLKAVNEVRPIETVKRVGYESIPYLASHSEDWLARTASGLKPARLFSRVEEDEFQIYENRVVKTLIDQIILYLRRKTSELERLWQQEEQINMGVNTGTFGFDRIFQIALSELLVSSKRSDQERSGAARELNALHKETARLLKKYRSLRQTRLYRYLKKSKPVENPLLETNILTMDKHYNTAFRLWKVMSRLKQESRDVDEMEQIAAEETASNYLLFCKTLVSYAAHVLKFELREDGSWFRTQDSLSLTLEEETGALWVTLKDKARRSMILSSELRVPIRPGERFGSFEYDGRILSWDNEVTEGDIELFCRELKDTKSRGKRQQDEKNWYNNLKAEIGRYQRQCDPPEKSRLLLIPAAVELTGAERHKFRDRMKEQAEKMVQERGLQAVIIALPKCDPDEQQITDYAKFDGERVMFLPLSMLDICSFRRLQNVLMRQIVLLRTESCPCCGEPMRLVKEQMVCDDCNIFLTQTSCGQCGHKFHYLSYSLPPEKLEELQKADLRNFYYRDSLFQYKDIVPMSALPGKLLPVCPHCGIKP